MQARPNQQQYGVASNMQPNPHMIRHPSHQNPMPSGIQQGPRPQMNQGQVMSVRPYGSPSQQDVAAQQQVLMLQIGSVAQIFSKAQDSNISYEEYHKRQLEAAGFLEQIEECRYREETMLNLEEAVTQSCLPRLFGLQEVNKSLTVKLFPPKRNPKAGETTAQEAESAESAPSGALQDTRYVYPSVLPYRGLDDGMSPTTERKAQSTSETRPPNLEECIENLILTCNNPMLSLLDPKGRQLRCLREVPVGGFVVAPSGVNFLTEMTFKVLKDTLEKCLEVYREGPYDGTIDEHVLGEAIRRLTDAN
eukprot:Blabericola_migrator_1__13275@NODE_928_length_6012_cov_115_691169_g645_i0_p4_GENE_NODE_928_length_6012_cov_115_691169_g645_i0NODE_928_length_6012_cov_115_691169_g645_i0_p4_ORF_typecomplete_len306_score36_25_NODE_928_length_6012_cov_115_691169_g645_i013872304